MAQRIPAPWSDHPIPALLAGRGARNVVNNSSSTIKIPTEATTDDGWEEFKATAAEWRRRRHLTPEEHNEIVRQIRESEGFDVTLPEGTKPDLGGHVNLDVTKLESYKMYLDFAVEGLKKKMGESLKLVEVMKLVMAAHDTFNFTLKMHDGKLDKVYRARVTQKLTEMKLTYVKDVTGVCGLPVEARLNKSTIVEASASSGIPNEEAKCKTESKKRELEREDNEVKSVKKFTKGC